MLPHRDFSDPLLSQLANLRLNQPLPRSASSGAFPPHISDPRLRQALASRPHAQEGPLAARAAQVAPTPRGQQPPTTTTQTGSAAQQQPRQPGNADAAWLGTSKAATLAVLGQQRVTGSPAATQDLFQFPIQEAAQYDANVVRRRPDWVAASHLAGNAARHAYLFPGNRGPVPIGQTIAGQLWADVALDLFDTEGCAIAKEWLTLDHVLAVIRLAIVGDRGAVWIYRDAIQSPGPIPGGAQGSHRVEASLKRYWIFPCNHGGVHWAVAILDRFTGQLVLFNSASTGTGKKQKADLEANLLAAIAATSFWSVQRADLQIITLTSPRQADKWECGLWVGEFVRAFLQDMAQPAGVVPPPQWGQSRCYQGATSQRHCAAMMVQKWMAAIRSALAHPTDRPLRDAGVIFRDWNNATVFTVPQLQGLAAPMVNFGVVGGQRVALQVGQKVWKPQPGGQVAQRMVSFKSLRPRQPLVLPPSRQLPVPPGPQQQRPQRPRPQVPAPGSQLHGVPAPQATQPTPPMPPPSGPTSLAPVYATLGPPASNYPPEHPPWFLGWEHIGRIRDAVRQTSQAKKSVGQPKDGARRYPRRGG
jgi:hypothetical protein